MSFSENLRIARDRRGYTQLYMAEKMGIDKSTYCGYETGKRQPDVEKIKQIAKILGVSGDELLETGFDSSHSEKQDEISKLFPQLTDENKDFVIKQIALLLAQQEGEE